jgi:Xaa-Pro dipeptidase
MKPLPAPPETDPARLAADAAARRERLRTWLDQEGLDGVILSRRDNFAWLTCGGDSHVLKNTEVGAGHLVITADRQYLLAYSMDAARLLEEQAAGQGYELVVLHWYDGDVRRRALDLAGKRVAADTLFPGAREANLEISHLHDPLTPLEVERCRWLGRAVAAILEDVASELYPGQTEEEIARLLHSRFILEGIELDVLIVGSDERIVRYRHPLPTRKPLERYLLLHPAARRWGLHANVSRSLHFGQPPEAVRLAYQAAATVEARIFALLKPGIRFQDIFEKQKIWYAELGFPDEWQYHFQGGPTGYLVSDGLRHQTDAVVASCQAFDWFITVTGAKVEELGLLTPHGFEVASQGELWPLMQVNTPAGSWNVPAIWVR